MSVVATRISFPVPGTRYLAAMYLDHRLDFVEHLLVVPYRIFPSSCIHSKAQRVVELDLQCRAAISAQQMQKRAVPAAADSLADIAFPD